MPAPAFSSQLPVIGTPTVHAWRIGACFTCSCGQGEPLLITSADQSAQCTGCGQHYQILQLHYDSRKHVPVGIEIARIARSRTLPTSEA